MTYRDDKGRTWEGARDGLRDVDFDHGSQGGFPVWTFELSSDGRLDRGETPLSAKPNGDSVFRPRPSGTAARRLPYYPDPLADYLVLQVRRAGGDPLPGAPLVVPVRGPGVAYPDVRPIAIEVVARARSGHDASHERVIGVEAETGTLLRGDEATKPGKRLAAYAIDAQGTLTRGNASPGQSVAVTRVRLELEPATPSMSSSGSCPTGITSPVISTWWRPPPSLASTTRRPGRSPRTPPPSRRASPGGPPRNPNSSPIA